MRFSHWCRALIITCLFIISEASARSIESPVPVYRLIRNSLLGQKITGNPYLLRQHLPLRTLIQKTAPVSKLAPLRYSSFEPYWQMSNLRNQRVGKGLEAILAGRANRFLQTQGSANRMMTTAALGFHTHPADLVLVSENGEILACYQSKYNLTPKSASKHLVNPKYAGMDLVTTRESYLKLHTELRRAETLAHQRGIPLAPKWQEIRSAFDEGRISGDWFDKRLPTQKGTEKLTRQETEEMFKKFMPIEEVSAPTSTLTRWQSGRILAKTMYVTDVAITGYLQIRDIQRYRRGELGGGYLAVKSAIRGTQLSLATYAIVTPDPFSKMTTVTIVVVLMAADMASDWLHDTFYKRRQAMAQNVLASIDQTERFYAVQTQLLARFN